MTIDEVIVEQGRKAVTAIWRQVGSGRKKNWKTLNNNLAPSPPLSSSALLPFPVLFSAAAVLG